MKSKIFKKYFKDALVCISAFLFLINIHGNAQSEELTEKIGLPFIQHFSGEDYGANKQNFDAVQDQNGLIYVANADGVLEYDGVNWRLIKLSNDKPAFSRLIDRNNRIYIGSQIM